MTMSTRPLEPPEPPNEQTEDSDVSERLDFTEERLEALEENQRSEAIEERLQSLEQGQAGEGDSDSLPPNVEGEGEKTLRLALAAFLNNEAVVRAVTELPKTIADAVRQRSEVKAKEVEAQKQISLRIYYWGLGFSALVLLVLSVLLWHDKITKELAAGLFGALIGYWYGYGRDRGRS